jgi:glutamate-1-semialdehyde 2,1-aminomutase
VLVTGARSARYDREAYRAWLLRLRDVCTERGIALIFDEVFLGFRLAVGGAQEYFGVRADLVTYGKTLGGGLPVGVLCGRHAWMKRYRDDHPSDVCFARGTFNSHPYVMAAMDEFLGRLEHPRVRDSYVDIDALWNRRAAGLNRRLEDEGLPVRFANMTSVWTTLFTQPGRFHWLFQYYLRAEGLHLSWVGSGRLIFSHDYSEQDFEAVAQRILAAARAMRRDGWWWMGRELTHRAIQRRILRELVRAFFLRSRSRPARPAQPAPEPTPVTPLAASDR